MNHSDFVHKKFRATDWEDEVKSYIMKLDVESNSMWHREGWMLKKASEELVTLGYYVKYMYGNDDSIVFMLNTMEGDVDGWIYKDGKQFESIQITIAYYERQEALLDSGVMNGEDVCTSGWVGDRLALLKDRVEQRIKNKVKMKYVNIDTLIVGVRD